MSNVVPVAPPGVLSTVPEQDEEDNENMAAATATTADGSSFPVMIAPDDLIVLGSESVHRKESRGDDSSSVVSAPSTVASNQQEEVSLQALLNRMKSTTSDFDLILNLLMERKWMKLFGSFSPSEFGIIISNVKIEVDHPRVAVMLAPHMNRGKTFTCQYAAAAIRRCAVSYRSVMTKRLLPLCADIQENYRVVLNELNEWERVATSSEFEEALLAASVEQ